MRFSLLIAALALTTSACNSGSDDNDTDGGNGVATQQGALTGRVSGASGHQSVAPGTANMQAERGSAMVGADTAVARTADGQVIGEASIGADGAYAFTELPAVTGAVVIEARAGGTVVGATLVPDGVGGEGIAAMPISTETTAEVEAFDALMADGHAAADIDAVGLMDHVSAEMAVSVASGAELAAGVWDAQEAWLDGMDAAGVTVDAAAAAAAQVGAYNRYAAAVHADAIANSDAAIAFEQDVRAALAGTLGADGEAMVTADAAASFALATELAGSTAADAATALAAAEIAHAEAGAQIALAEGAVSIRIEEAYAAYDAAIADAGDARTIAAAYADLSASLRSDDGGSIFDAVIEAGFQIEGLEDLPDGLPVDLDGILSEALEGVQEALGEAQVALDEALAALEGAGEAGQAFFDFRGQLETALTAGLGAYLDADAVILALELSAAADGNAAAFLTR
jgi:hypothetical protein